MKALKQEYSSFTDCIVAAICHCYGNTDEPSGAELMKLYWEIGFQICCQGEKAFVAYLVHTLGERFPNIKGFSARILRRMRELYHTYENSPELKALAMTVGWTQNVLILEGCEDEVERRYYLRLTVSRQLSKLELMSAMENGMVDDDVQSNDSDDQNEETPEPYVDASAICLFAFAALRMVYSRRAAARHIDSG